MIQQLHFWTYSPKFKKAPHLKCLFFLIYSFSHFEHHSFYTIPMSFLFHLHATFHYLLGFSTALFILEKQSNQNCRSILSIYSTSIEGVLLYLSPNTLQTPIIPTILNDVVMRTVISIVCTDLGQVIWFRCCLFHKLGL